MMAKNPTTGKKTLTPAAKMGGKKKATGPNTLNPTFAVGKRRASRNLNQTKKTP